MAEGDERCLDCFRRGIGRFLRLGGLSGDDLDQTLTELMAIVESGLGDNPPPIAGAPAYTRMRILLGGRDIFQPEKSGLTSSLLESMEDIGERLGSFPDPLSAALRASTWGNTLDVAQGADLPSVPDLVDELGRKLSLDDTREFLDRLESAGMLLVLGDNAGESVLDRLFLDRLEERIQVYYTARPHPVLNDSTVRDAEEAGLQGRATIVSTGLDAPTVVRGRVSEELDGLIDRADLILSKGQGNLEGLMGLRDERLYFSYVVKCPVIASISGAPVGSGIFASSLRIPVDGSSPPWPLAEAGSLHTEQARA